MDPDTFTQHCNRLFERITLTTVDYTDVNCTDADHPYIGQIEITVFAHMVATLCDGGADDFDVMLADFVKRCHWAKSNRDQQSPPSPPTLQ
jgi:hypothetical protein